MSCKPDQWVADWLKEERSKGNTGLTVEKRGNSYIVKWATTVWDKETKKRKKISEYRGTLNRDGSVTPPRRRRSKEIAVVDTITDSGSAKLLAWATQPILGALKGAFPDDYPEIVLLSWTRCLGKGRLNVAGRCWKKLDDVLGVRPNTSPKSLSETLRRVGLMRGLQDDFFRRLAMEESEMAVDLSVIFSRSRGAFMNKSGYNRFRLSCPQFNLLLGCGLRSGRPHYMKVVPGNVKENCAVSMLDEYEIPKGTMLVMDRGYGDRKFLAAVREKGLDYLVAVKRNSTIYELTDTDGGVFRWRESAVKYGRTELGNGEWAYRFENLDHRNEEIVEALRSEEKGGKGTPDLEKAGNFVMISSREMEPEAAYKAYKSRVSVEGVFDDGKNVLSMDRTYMRDDMTVMGHLFVTFVAMQILFGISRLIDDNGLSSKYSPNDVLDIYSAMKSLNSAEEIRQAVPKDVRDLDARLGLFLYSTEEDRRKLNGEKKRPGRKKKSEP